MGIGAGGRGVRLRAWGALVAGGALVASGLAPVPALAAGRPDLVVTAVSPAVPGVQATGSQVLLRATITNQGTAATPAGVVHGVAFAVDGRTVSWSDTSTASLAPGASRTVVANGGPDGDPTWRAGTGSATVRARVDDVRRIAESSETNNDRSTTVASAPVLAPTGVDVRPAVTQEQFDRDHGRTVRVRWAVPAGQPVGVRYEVVEHPVWADGGWCGEQSPRTAVSTTGTSATFDMTTGRDCPNHAEGYRDTYSVRAVHSPGATSATSARTGECLWWRDRYTQFEEFSFDCGGVVLHDSLTGGTRVDVGASQDSPGYEKDQGFTGGTVHTASGTALPTHLRTSRWGFTRYVLPMGAPGTKHVVIRMVEPTFTARGRRVFDLRVNGQLVARDLDIFAEVGRGQELTVHAEVQAPTGVVEVVPTAKVDNPIIASIELQ